MIDSGQPLGHGVVVGVLRAERELQEPPRRRGRHPPGADATIGAESRERRAAFGDQPATNVAARARWSWRAIDGADEVIVEVRRAYAELGLFQRHYTEMRPRRLPERGERERVRVADGGIRGFGGPNVAEEIRAEQTGCRRNRPERRHLAQELAAVRSHDLDRSDLTGSLTDIQIGRATQLNASVGQVHAALRVRGKLGKKLVADGDYLVRLPAAGGHLARDLDVLGIAPHAAEGVARQRVRRSVAPGHDHPRVQPPGERHTDLLVTTEVARQRPHERFAQLLIVGFRLEWFLLLPLARLEIRALVLYGAITYGPGRRWG